METIEQATADFAQRVETCLKRPGEAERDLQEVQERLEALRPSLGTRSITEASRVLSGSRMALRQTRLRLAAEVISAGLREIGIRVDPGAPLKRAPRKKPTPKLAPAQPEPVREVASPVVPATEEARERGGLLQRQKVTS